MMRRDFLVGVGCFASTIRMSRAAQSPQLSVITDDGIVRGRLRNDVRVFTGIPYAEPPIGALRFAQPRPARAWQGEFDATRPAGTPLQDADPSLPPVTPISEDCLQLNVWAPSGRGHYPVFVWIYGGGNYSGSSNQPAYDGEKFARDGIVFVSVNYRVGVCGFLELGEIIGPAAYGSGNNGIRDQVLALAWVKTNIAAFGGDPTCVTIGGQSAGAWNCATLMGLPAAKGLFGQAVLASGGGDTVFTIDQANAFAALFVNRLGGKDRLRVATATDLLNAQHAAAADCPDLLPFRPVIDGNFLSGAPIDLIRAGAARHVTTMLGHTRDEYRTLLSPDQAERPITQKMVLNLNLRELPPVIDAYKRAFPTVPTGELMLRMLGAELIGMPTLRIAEAQSAAGASVFYYNLQYSVPNGPFGSFSAHGIDVPLIFERINTQFARTVFGYDPADIHMARQVHAAWTSFIKSGSINAGTTPWPRYDLDARWTMKLDKTSVAVRDPERTERLICPVSDNGRPITELLARTVSGEI